MTNQRRVKSGRRSLRRVLLDDSMTRASSYIAGTVLDVGGVQPASRRGNWSPPESNVDAWINLNVSVEVRPNVLGDAAALPLRGSSVETVVCTEVLEYLIEPQEALREIHRVLRPGGHLLLSAPFLHREDAEGDLYRFTSNWVGVALPAAGFDVILLEKHGTLPVVIVNFFAQAVQAAPRGFRRILWVLTRPVRAAALWLNHRRDASTGFASSYSTGFFAVARKKGGASS